MERLLGGIARALDGLAAGNLELRKAFGDLSKAVLHSHSRQESRLGDLQVAIDTFLLRVEAVVEHQKSVVGATVDAREALTDSKRELSEVVRAAKEVTGKIKTMRPEETDAEVAPRLAHKALDFMWPTAVRRGPEAIRWGFSLLAGTGFLASIGHWIWRAIHAG